MINKVTIKNYKCFTNEEIDFKRVTVLAGANSAGKSSIIQCLLLSRIALEKLIQYSLLDQEVSNEQFISVPLNGKYLLALGNTQEVLTRNSESNVISIELGSLTGNIKLSFKAEDNRNDIYNLELQPDFLLSGDFMDLKNEFYYLNAERIGPRITYDVDQLDYIHVGYQGEYSIQILAQYKEDSITQYSNCLFPGSSDSKMLNQVREWMSYITPGFYLDEAQLEGKLKKAFTTFSKSSPTNVGFGISYVLPIIVSGLLAKKENLFIVENPEAHLHPKGQSNIGYFLGMLASCGIQILVETHSEHVVNGLRRAVYAGENITTNDMLINFFQTNTEKECKEIVKINLSEKADLSLFPRDFFDQVTQDMSEIFKIRKNKNG